MNDGRTIGYSAYIQEILNKIHFQGLPPFGSLLLILIALLKKKEQGIENILDVIKGYDPYNENLIPVLNKAVVDYEKLFNIITDLPSEYKEGKKKISLLQTLFQDAHNKVSIPHSSAIAKEFSTLVKLPNANFGRQEDYQLNQDDIYRKDFSCISSILKHFPSSSSILKSLYELPKIDEKLELEETSLSLKKEKEFPEELIENKHTYKVGALIKHIWSGLNIPMHHSIRGELPLGGVSDLSNKGNFDNLLLTEYAYDDDHFLSRLANNEALFLQRESPPQEDQFERNILIDTSIRNWGAVKIMAHAFTLAVAKHPKTKIPCNAFLVGKDYHLIKLDEPKDVIKNLDFIDASANAAAGLSKYLKEEPRSKQASLFWVCSDESFRSAEIQQVFQSEKSRFKYWIIIDRVGKIKVFRNTPKGLKEQQNIEVDLEDIWAKNKRHKPKEQHIEGNLSYPILLPKLQASKKMLVFENKIYKVTKDWCLLKALVIGTSIIGWELIYTKVPRNCNNFGIGIFEEETYLLSYSPNKKEVKITNINTGHTDALNFEHKRYSLHQHFIFHKGAFHYLYNHSKSWRYNLDPGLVSTSIGKEYTELIEIHESHENDLKHQSKLANYVNYSVLKNVHKIYVNDRDELVLNSHVLQLPPKNSHAKWMPGIPDSLNTKIESERQGHTLFTFPSGHTARIDRKGMLILSSDNQIIYIPLKLGKSLYMCSAKHACYVSGQSEILTHKVKIISGIQFYRKEIQNFIKEIVAYEARSKTI